MPLALNTTPTIAVSRSWMHRHHALEAAGYGVAGAIGLAVVPALFVGIDHAVVVRWSNEILDLLDLL